MTRPSPIAIIALCIVALAILAFTINEEFGKKKHFSSDAVPITKDANIISAIGATNPPHGQPGHRHDLPDGAPIPDDAVMPATTTSAATDLPGTNISSPTSSDAILNPAHGQPGHRCDIAVGAPLNSSPTNSTVPTTTNTAVASGKNPAHGQPGHRCDIAVGADLNSAPAKATTITPSRTASIAGTNQNTVATGLNPAHGQPGHRCDIAVGAPLNSPKKDTITTISNSASLNSPVFPNYTFPGKDSSTTRAPQ